MKQMSTRLRRKTTAAYALAVVLALVTAGFGQAAPAGGTGRGNTGNPLGGGRGALPTAPPAADGSAPTAKPYSTATLDELVNLAPAPNLPANNKDLKAIQDRVEIIARNALPAIVNIIVADGQGSGVIVSKDGYVLTAGHVSGTPNKPVRIRLSNGTVVDAVSLGTNDQLDSGMVKITTLNDYSFMPVGTVKDLVQGQWVLAMGHPGGYQAGRQPVVRLGKILNVIKTRREWFIQSDCPLIMGDSGGPVFDLNGFVIGINSKIGRAATSNVHVPIDTFTESWDRLARGDEWGGTGFLADMGRGGATPAVGAPTATLSIVANDDPAGVIVTNVKPDKASDKAGLVAEDIITKINDAVVRNLKDLASELAKHKPGETVALELLHKNSGGKSVTQVKKVVLDSAESK